MNERERGRKRERVRVKEEERKRGILLRNVGGRDSLRSPGRGEGGASYTVYELVYIQQRRYLLRPDAADVGVDVAETVGDHDAVCIRQSRASLCLILMEYFPTVLRLLLCGIIF